MPLPAFAPPLTAVATAAVTFALAWLLGRPALRHVVGLHRIERITASILFGLLAQAGIALALGLFGWLRPLPCAVTTVGCALLATRLRPLPNRAHAATAGQTQPGLPQWTWWLLPVAFVPLILATLQPPAFSDSGMYHLPLIEHFANAGAVTPATDHVLPVFAVLFHVLACAPYQLGGETAVQLLHLGLFTCSGLILLGAGHRMRMPHISWIAACLWWGQPAFAGNGSQALVDCAWPAFAAMSFSMALLAWQQRVRANPQSTSPALACPMLLAGLFGGAAGATKYTGFLIALPLGLVSVALTFRGDRTAILRSLVGGLLGCGPWLLWIYAHSGDPLFPYWLSLEGGPYWSPEDLRQQRMTWIKLGGGHELRDAAMLPIRLVTDSSRFLTGAPLSPFLMWLGLPFALLAALTTRAGSILAATVTIGFAIWFGHSQQLRFLSGITLALCWLAAVGLRRSRLLNDDAPGHRRAMTLGWICLTALPAYGGYRVWRDGLPPTTIEQRDAKQIARHATLPTHWWLAEAQPNARVYALFGERSRHAATAGRALDYTGSWFGQGRFRDIWQSQNNSLRAANVIAAKLDELECTHLCISMTAQPNLQLLDLSPAHLMRGSSRWRVERADASTVLLALDRGATKRTLAATPDGPATATGERRLATTADTTWVLSLPTTDSPGALLFLGEDNLVLHSVRQPASYGDAHLLIGTAPPNTHHVALSEDVPADAELRKLVPGS